MPPFYADPARRPALVNDKYTLDNDESEFFKTLTGIHDDEELKDHILRVQAKAYEIYGYPCIRRFSFLRLKIYRQEAYAKALALLQTRAHPILLDIGCCFGNDTRKVVVDGWPVDDVIASDLRQGFWDCGHDLFKSTPESFPAAFVPGDVFDNSFLDISSPSTATDGSPPSLSSLKDSITPLIHRVSAIHAAAFFHLFSESKQAELATRLAALLVPAKGSIIFGQHNALPEKSYRVRDSAGVISNVTPEAAAEYKDAMFCHSLESWTKLWTEDVFGKLGIAVKVEAKLDELERWDVEFTPGTKFWIMNWSVQII